MEFKFTIEEHNTSNNLNRCYCNKCKWDGLPSDCSTEIEQESWEMPEYVVYLCPECDDEAGVEFYQSKELLKRQGK